MRQNLLHNSNSQLKRELDSLLASRTKEDPDRFASIPVETSLSKERFKTEYADKDIPVIIRNAVRDWPALTKWDLPFFREQFGSVEVVSNLYNKQNTAKVRLDEFTQLLEMKADSPSYLQEWWFQLDCPELLDDIATPEWFEDDENLRILGYKNNTLWLGQGGSFTPLHQDTVHTNVWTAQIFGSKEWLVIDKSAEILSEDGSYDLDAFIEEAGDRIMIATLHAGDILYLPYKWWHRAASLELSMSYNCFYVTRNIVQQYIKDIFSIPLATALNPELMKEFDPMRLEICQQRCETFGKLMNFNCDNVLGIDVSGAAKRGIYEDAA